MSKTSFYWHDYETFGADPARDRPVQFAGLRTDDQLNVIGEPLVIFCRPANDFLPQPGACLVTGIAPQHARSKGVPECEFIARIHDQLSVPGTCGIGYNSLRFDDEVTRHTLYRNFFDAYEREYQHGNSRWDIIDMLRTAWALRPDGIEWPLRKDGLPSFRLEELTAANGIQHQDAHDALADVHATIAMARKVRQRQPRLYDYLCNHRDKQSSLAQLDIETMKPVLHVSGMFGASRHNIALVAPLAQHPTNRNEIICFDLDANPAALFDLDEHQLRTLLFTRSDDLPDDTERPGLKSVHINRCPVLLPAKMADTAIAERVGIDGDRCRRHLAELREGRAALGGAFVQRLQAVYGARDLPEQNDPDLMLYSGGFFSSRDKRSFARVRTSSPAELAQHSFVFEDKRLNEMLFRYRARNFPESLDEAEAAQWEEYRFLRITDPDYGASLCMEAFQTEVEALLAEQHRTPQERRLLEQLMEYADELLA